MRQSKRSTDQKVQNIVAANKRVESRWLTYTAIYKYNLGSKKKKWKSMQKIMEWSMGSSDTTRFRKMFSKDSMIPESMKGTGGSWAKSCGKAQEQLLETQCTGVERTSRQWRSYWKTSHKGKDNIKSKAGTSRNTTTKNFRPFSRLSSFLQKKHCKVAPLKNCRTVRQNYHFEDSEQQNQKAHHKEKLFPTTMADRDE